MEISEMETKESNVYIVYNEKQRSWTNGACMLHAPFV